MNVPELLNELNFFQGRETGLRSVWRYSLYSKMWYRTNLWTHSRRVAWMVEEMIPTAQRVFGDSFDPKRAVALALVHDDAEILFGDIQAGNKAKMSNEELEKIKQQELDAINELASGYPAMIGGYSYKSLLLEAVEKKSNECVLLNWADKYDAFCEALHELYAGNVAWTVNVENEYGKIALPTEYYMDYFRSFQKKFPTSAELFLEGSSWLLVPQEPDLSLIIKSASLHTETSLVTPKGYTAYDQWVALTLREGTSEDRADLVIRKEL